jgi:hypothetical protein
MVPVEVFVWGVTMMMMMVIMMIYSPGGSLLLPLACARHEASSYADFSEN